MRKSVSPIPTSKFNYVSLSKFRTMTGISTDDLDNVKLTRLINLASVNINMLTSQWFEPVIGTFALDGDGSQIVHSVKRVPIIQISGLEVNSYRNAAQVDREILTFGFEDQWDWVIDEDYFHFGDRFIEFLLGTFPHGVGNVLAEGVWGWIENVKCVITTTAEAVEAATTEFELTEIEPGSSITLGSYSLSAVSEASSYPDCFEVRDVLIFFNEDGKEIFRTFANAINYSTKKITIDAPGTLKTALPSGTQIISFGSVPLLIEEACVQLVTDIQHNIGSSAQQDYLGKHATYSEKTDKYQYFNFMRGQGSVPDISVSASVRVENILAHYCAPPEIAVI